MTHEELEQIKDAIEDSITRTVNGKIDRLNDIMELHMRDDKLVADKLIEHLAKDEEWKKEATPVVEMGKNVNGFGKVTLYLIGFIMAVVGIFSAFTAVMNKLKWG